MIWFWLWRLVIATLRVVLPIEPVREVIDPNETCPACGNKDGSLEFTRMPVNQAFVPDKCPKCDSSAMAYTLGSIHCNECGYQTPCTIDTISAVKRTCAVCKYKYMIKPIRESLTPC